MTEGLAISARGLTKRYKQVVAVDNLDLDIPIGTVYGFLGPNGAGKTTTIRMLLGLVRPTTGSAQVLGHDIDTERSTIAPTFGAIVERSVSMSWPRTCAQPTVGRTRPSSIRIVVVLPAPFGPRKP